MSETIKIYARVRPPFKKRKFSADRYDIQSDTEKPRLTFRIPKDEAQGLINNSREVYDFQFDHVFDTQTKQEEVFDCVAKDVIDSCLEGYNGTIFAYGQVHSFRNLFFRRVLGKHLPSLEVQNVTRTVD
jgi:kinesin family protein 6/9